MVLRKATPPAAFEDVPFQPDAAVAPPAQHAQASGLVIPQDGQPTSIAALAQQPVPAAAVAQAAPAAAAAPATPAAQPKMLNSAPAPAPAAKPRSLPVVQQGGALQVASPLAQLKPGGLFASLKQETQPFTFGTFPRFSGNQGVIQTLDGKLILGRTCVLQLVCWNDWWLITPGERTKETAELVKYSDDGKYIADTDILVDDYIAQHKEQYSKMSKKPYTSLWGLVLNFGVDGNCESIKGQMVEISLAPLSRKSFSATDIQTQVDIISRKRDPRYATVLTITASPEVLNGNSFTKLKVSGTPDAEAEALVAAYTAEVSE